MIVAVFNGSNSHTWLVATIGFLLLQKVPLSHDNLENHKETAQETLD